MLRECWYLFCFVNADNAKNGWKCSCLFFKTKGIIFGEELEFIVPKVAFDHGKSKFHKTVLHIKAIIQSQCVENICCIFKTGIGFMVVFEKTKDSSFEELCRNVFSGESESQSPHLFIVF